MSLISSLKCICCLIRWNKYLYFCKKILCFSAVILSAITGVYLLKGSKIGRLI